MTPTPPDRDVVEGLVTLMLDGAKSMQGAFTASELSSACFTMTLRVIETVLQQDPNSRSVVREAVGTLLMACADLGRPN